MPKQPWISCGYDIDWDLFESLDPNSPPVILSWGMGVDSTAMLLRFLFEPSCRDFPLQNLVLVVAMTGDEWKQTAELVRKFILPLCRRFGIWLIQVSRAGESERNGIVIHTSRCPRWLYIAGAYTLKQHLLVNGIVPQKAKGKRFCTMKFKAFVIDALVKLFFGDSTDVRYRRMIGFNAEEKGRAQKDSSYGNAADGASDLRYLVDYNADEVGRATKDSSMTTAQHYRYLLGFNKDEVARQKKEAVTWRNQMFEFPLIKWGWTRQICKQYIAEMTYLLKLTEQVWVEAGGDLDQHAIHAANPATLWGATIEPTEWESCCGYCPHSCSNGGDDLARRARLRQGKRPKSVKLSKMVSRWQAEPEMGGLAAYIEHNALAFSHYSGALYDTGAKKQGELYIRFSISSKTLGSQQRSKTMNLVLAAAYGTEPKLVALSYRFWICPRPRDESKRPFADEMFVCVFREVKDKQDERIDFEALWQSVTKEPTCG